MGNAQSEQGGGPLPKADLERLDRRLKRVGSGSGEVTLSDLRRFPELADNAFLPRLFELFDTDADGYLTRSDLRYLLETIMRVGGDEDARLDFAFRAYDADGDGFVSLPELIARFRESTGVSRADHERVSEAARAVLARFDLDGDGRLNRMEFRNMLRASAEGVRGVGWGRGFAHNLERA